MTHPAWLAQIPEPDRSDLLAEYKERAAIREFEGGQARFAAEMGAWEDLRRRYFKVDDERRRLGNGMEHGIPPGPRPAI